MKKLIIAMGAATMAALCAQAKVPEGYKTGTDFQDYVIIEDGVNANGGKVINFTDLGAAGDSFWTGAADDDSKVVAKESNKYLAVDSTTGLTRSAGEVAGAIPEDGDITVAAKVQFTAADEAPTVADGDKLLVWMQAAAEAEGTEGTEGYKPAKKNGVMVTDKTGAKMIKEVADVEAFTAAWHTLAIKAVAAGTEAQPTTEFSITLDGEEFAGPFKSLVTGGDTAQTIASIGFKGTGAVDDIGFVATDGEVVPDITVNVAVTGDATIYTDAEATKAYTGTPFVVKAGAAVTLYVGDDDGTLTVESNVGVVGEYDDENCVWPVTFTTDAEATEAATVTFDITVTQGGAPIDVKPTITLSPTEVTFGDTGYALPKVTLEGSYTFDVDYTYEWDGALPLVNPTANVTLTVTVTMKGKYKGSNTATFTVKPKSGETWPESWEVPESATGDQFTAYKAWVAAGNDPTATNAKEAFLMGVNLDEKFEPLAATSIAIVDGKVVITTNAGETPNGVIYVKYGDTVECKPGVAAIDADLDTTDKLAQFFKVCIDFAMPKTTVE